MHDKPEIDVSVYRFSVFLRDLDRLTDVNIQALSDVESDSLSPPEEEAAPGNIPRPLVVGFFS
jgi:hypothetical protein